MTWMNRQVILFGTKFERKEDMEMINYQKPIVAALESASAAIQHLGKLMPTNPDGGVRTSGNAYDLDE
jgi:hypothetical protein